MTDAHSPTQAFRDARDLLLRHREDYPAALAEFSWPRLDEFNWALGWFDVIAAGHPAGTALAILGHTRQRLSPYKRIRRLEFSELPKTISGKIRRSELRERS